MSLTSEALDRLAGQFQGSPKLRGMLEAIVGPLDTVLSDVDALKNERWIDTAVGAQLDGCGQIVGENRAGRDDDAYRDAIRYRVFVNVSNATPNDLIQALTFLVGGDDKQYLEVYPATVLLFSDGPSPPADIQTQIQDVSPAAISDVPVLVSYAEKPFRFSKSAIPGDLYANGKRFKVNGKFLQVSTGATLTSGPTLGGIVPTKITAGGKLVRLSSGALLCINSPNHDKLLDSGFHLTGVFQ